MWLHKLPCVEASENRAPVFPAAQTPACKGKTYHLGMLNPC